jgi:hypothetical protein
LAKSDIAKRLPAPFALRHREVEVHLASNIDDASRLWTRCSYDLVLLAAEEGSEEATLLSNELKKRKRRQRMALLVGAPEYIREIGLDAATRGPTDKQLAPVVVITNDGPPRNQWHVMLERLLAAG